jgi:dimethyl sulfoxide reductase iron-sulfur subunit
VKNPFARRVGRRRAVGLAAGGFTTFAASALVMGASPATEGQPTPAQTSAKERPGKRLRRWSMVIDLRRCDGCQAVGKPPQCTEACIEAHYAPEPMEWMQVYEADLPGGGTQFIPTPCQQCQNAPCVNMCPVGATFATPEGVVLIDQQRCIGCRICLEGCMYDRRFFNWGQPQQPPEAMFMEYDPEHQTPAIKGTVMKCDFCPDMARAGRLPYCAQGCPNKAIYYGDLEEDVATNGREVIAISQFLAANSGFRLKQNLGTEPRVYYIPGHGELVGRTNPRRKGRRATQWPWQKRLANAGGDGWTR